MEQQQIIELIKHYCLPCGKVYHLSSYGLKCLFEHLAGRYISNEQFKQSMRAAGFEPCKVVGKNSYYLIEIVNSPEIPYQYVSPKEQERRFKYGRL